MQCSSKLRSQQCRLLLEQLACCLGCHLHQSFFACGHDCKQSSQQRQQLPSALCACGVTEHTVFPSQSLDLQPVPDEQPGGDLLTVAVSIMTL